MRRLGRFARGGGGAAAGGAVDGETEMNALIRSCDINITNVYAGVALLVFALLLAVGLYLYFNGRQLFEVARCGPGYTRRDTRRMDVMCVATQSIVPLPFTTVASNARTVHAGRGRRSLLFVLDNRRRATRRSPRSTSTRAGASTRRSSTPPSSCSTSRCDDSRESFTATTAAN